MNRFAQFWKEHRSILLYILVLFLVSRILISLLSFTTFHYLKTPEHMPAWRKEIYTEHPYLAQWTIWDSEWYLKLAQEGYVVNKPFDPGVYQTIGFFPLYSLTIAPLGFILGDYVVAGILLSNIYFLAACFFLYKLIRLDWPEQDARRTLFYLFLFPTAYILSALYSESLILLLFCLSLYAARKERWILAGSIGLLAALTKPTGFVVALPLLIIYLQQRNFSWKQIRWNILAIGLAPLGLFLFALLGYYLTGDLFAYTHIKKFAWNHDSMNPFMSLYTNLFTRRLDEAISSIENIIALTLLFFGFKKIPIAYWAFALVLIVFPLTTDQIIGSLRYMVVVFPLLMILAAYGRNEHADRAIIMTLALLQGFFLVYWTANFWFIA